MTIREDLDHLSIIDFEGDIEDVIDYLTEIQEKYSSTHSLLRLEYGNYYGDEGLNLKGSRPETEQETSSRVSKEAVSAELQRLGKIAQYNKLKEELGIQ